MADVAVQFLLDKLSQAVMWYGNLITGAENDLEQLKSDLNLCKAFLLDAAKKPNKDEVFREIERQIRAMVYEADDTIDDCLTQEAKARARDKSSSKHKFNLMAKMKKSLANTADKADVRLPLKVSSLRTDKMQPILDKMERWANFQVAGAGSGATLDDDEYAPTNLNKELSIRTHNVVGFKDEEEKLVNYLKEPKDRLDVISIVGMPGQGKTTLAWKIFNTEAIRKLFPIHVWVNVSGVLNRRDVLLTIAKKSTNQELSRLSNQELADRVRKYLDQGNFLLVLDDVWYEKDWNVIRDFLPMNNKTGKVMITTRETTVATHANPARAPHKLRFLTEDESWELLQYEVFRNLDDCPPELVDTGKYVANQCKGLPLAIVVIGGILIDHLYQTDNLDLVNEKWLEVSKNVGSHIKSNKEYNISEIVAMSYNRLPEDLRDCFIYLGVFPEDYEIPARTLTRLWISEGFIQAKDGKSLEKTAEGNLKELIDRNLVMVKKLNPNDEVLTCGLHDVVRSFCTSKSEIKEQNLFQEINFSEGVFQPPVEEIKKYRRLCIHSNLTGFIAKRPKGPSARSMMSFNNTPEDLNPKDTPVIPDAFELLRVLDTRSIRFNQFPEGLTKLMHLRYITVSGTKDMDVLPKAISDLLNLQTLVLLTDADFLTIKANIWMMSQLRHLITKSAAIILAIDGDDGNEGENLQTLSRLSPHCCTNDVFDRARNLKKLGICGKLAELFVGGKSLENLKLLEKLKLINNYKSNADRVHALPQGNFFPACLKRLTIIATFLDWTQMSALAKINSLQVLKLKKKAFTGECWEAVGHGFRSLHYLLIEETDLAEWEASADYFPSLKTLVLKKCENLNEIPMGVTKRLEILTVDGLKDSAVESAQKIAEKKHATQRQSKSRWGGKFTLTIDSRVYHCKNEVQT